MELYTGTVISAEKHHGIRNQAYIVTVDFGHKGILKTSAQITELYNIDYLIGKQVIGRLDVPKKQIGHIISEFLLLGVTTDKGVVLLSIYSSVDNGLRVH